MLEKVESLEKKFGRNWAISKSALVEYLQSHQQIILPQQNISPVVSHFAPLVTLASMPEMGERGETKEVKRVEENLVVDVKKNWMSWKKYISRKLQIPIHKLQINYKVQIFKFQTKKN